MKWVFSDGTVANLGGDIEGASYFAQLLRECLADPAVTVEVWPAPEPGLLLDANDPALFDRFLRTEMNRGNVEWMMLSLVEAPEPDELPALPPPPWDDAGSADDLMMY